MKAIWLVGYVPASDSLTEWVLRLVETGIDGQTRSADVMAIDRSDDFGDLANLGLTLAEAKQVLTHVRRDVVGAQARNHAMFRPDCQAYGGSCHVKDWRPSSMARRTASGSRWRRPT
jgi:hypothetical protein